MSAWDAGRRSASLVVVGSGPGGLAAAQSFREHDATSPVLLVSADPHPPYARPPLTKDYLTGESERSELWLAEQSWFADHDVSLRLGTEVVALDRGLGCSGSTTGPPSCTTGSSWPPALGPCRCQCRAGTTRS